MLEAITNVSNLGLFQSSTSGDVPFAKMTRIYGENGRGKTTLCSLFRSLSAPDTAELNRRRTIDANSNEIRATLHFSDCDEVLDNGAWAPQSHSFEIFDSVFVKDNVYAGGQVDARQRQNLLAFALGEESVSESRRRDFLKNEREQFRLNLKSIEAQLLAICNSRYNINEFEKLLPRNDDQAAQDELAALRREFDDTKNLDVLRQKPILTKISTFDFDFQNLEHVLKSSFESISQEAAQHVQKLVSSKKSGYVAWLQSGLAYCTDETCPFCQQTIKDLDLIDDYDTYFSREYNDLTNSIQRLSVESEHFASIELQKQIASEVERMHAELLSWRGSVFSNDYTISVDDLMDDLKQFAAAYKSAVERKMNAPLQSIDGTLGELITSWNKLQNTVNRINSDIDGANVQIAGYQKSLTTKSSSSIGDSIQRLEDEILRGRQKTVNLFAQRQHILGKIDQNRETLEASRQALITSMQATLQRYKDAVNHTLDDFNASFHITEMKPNFQGQHPQNQYMLQLRNHSVPFQSNVGPSFEVSLSDGDKRTLAIAFFFAKAKLDSELKDKIIVVDDPMSSMDQGRRYYTANCLSFLAFNAQQLIVLSHDAYFLRDLKTTICKHQVKGQSQITRWPEFRIKRSKNNYSAIVQCDLDDICASEYRKNVLTIKKYLDGVDDNFAEVATVLRPTVEGYLKRRYALYLEKADQLANMQKIINDNPDLGSAKVLLTRINELRIYGNSQEHAGNPDLDYQKLNDESVMKMAREVWDLLYS